MSDTIVYEHPLTEKTRCYLRIENLSDQLLSYRHISDALLFKPFFSLLFSLAEQIDRGELKKELIRDLDNQKIALQRLRGDDGIDNERLEHLISKLEKFNFAQVPPNSAQRLIQKNPLLNQIKNKSALAGGGCQFDTPMLHYWNHLPAVHKTEDFAQWLAPYESTIEAIRLLLQLTRESSSYSDEVASDGFYQSSCDKTQLIRLKLSVQQGCYPTISGYRSRYAIRFIAWNEQPLHDIKFELACC